MLGIIIQAVFYMVEHRCIQQYYYVDSAELIAVSLYRRYKSEHVLAFSDGLFDRYAIKAGMQSLLVYFFLVTLF